MSLDSDLFKVISETFTRAREQSMVLDIYGDFPVIGNFCVLFDDVEFYHDIICYVIDNSDVTNMFRHYYDYLNILSKSPHDIYKQIVGKMEIVIGVDETYKILVNNLMGLIDGQSRNIRWLLFNKYPNIINDKSSNWIDRIIIFTITKNDFLLFRDLIATTPRIYDNLIEIFINVCDIGNYQLANWLMMLPTFSNILYNNVNSIGAILDVICSGNRYDIFVRLYNIVPDAIKNAVKSKFILSDSIRKNANYDLAKFIYDNDLYIVDTPIRNDIQDAFNWACYNGYLRIASWLYNKSSVIVSEKLIMAIYQIGRLSIIDFIVEKYDMIIMPLIDIDKYHLNTERHTPADVQKFKADLRKLNKVITIKNKIYQKRKHNMAIELNVDFPERVEFIGVMKLRNILINIARL